MTTPQVIHHYLDQPLFVGAELNGRTVRLLSKVNGQVVKERAAEVFCGAVRVVPGDIPEVPAGSLLFICIDSRVVQKKRARNPVEELKDGLTIIISSAQEMRGATEITDSMLDDLQRAAERSLMASEALEALVKQLLAKR